MQETASHLPTINPSALYRAKECARFYSIGLSTWWHWSKIGKVKRGTKLGSKITVWEGSYLLELKRELMDQAQGGEV
ncbi:hypothetical protein SAMN05660479_02568 [Microbulbifer thermotolerans]|uniref:helix-turn-helix transcriptional regulator n=1 Tax=Microbulbifer thermotolerans TaxID=252514 RepID=UPI0008EFA174|nr:hypothetical protein [Microbulbifer thermotolerans]SFC86225.1 hypothetical protein SAMN05660479_02568 [Microbulbifer thermotolerans]